MTTIAGDPEKVRLAAATLSDRAEALAGHSRGTRCQQVAAAVVWRGAGATQFACAAATHAQDAQDSADRLRPLATAVRTFAGDLARHQESERSLLRRLGIAECDLRDVRTALQLGPLDTSGATPADLTAAIATVKRLNHELEGVRGDHRRSLRALHIALTTYTPPLALWQRGMQTYGLGLAYWNLYQKGSAAFWLWKTRGPALAVPTQRRVAAITVVEKGTVTGFLEKGWMTKVFRGRTGGLLLKTVRATSALGMVEAMVPGAKDVWTGGGYTGWRDPATRAMGLVEISGVVAARYPETRPIGSGMLVTYTLWKAANKGYDNKENLSDSDFWLREARTVLRGEMESFDLGVGGLAALWLLDRRKPRNVTSDPPRRTIKFPNGPILRRVPYGPPAPWLRPIRPPRPGEVDPFARFSMAAQ